MKGQRFWMYLGFERDARYSMVKLIEGATEEAGRL